MKNLNELYNKSCKPGYKTYKKISSNITLIDNFFEDFETARDFFINREKWKCIAYQGNSKPGCESLFPEWIGKSLMENYILDNKINNDLNSYKISLNFFYYDTFQVNCISNTNDFPHTDGVEKDNVLGIICLINLNKVLTSTKFYRYKNKEHLTIETQDEWHSYNKKLETKLRKYYNKDIILREESKIFLDTQKLDTELIETVEYKPNQAIIYPENLFHSANVTEEFTENNPRCILRIMFDTKTNNFKPNKINRISYL